MPPYSAFDPVNHAWVLGYISVIDALPDGDCFYRIDGTYAVEFFKVEMSRRRLGEFPFPERRRRIREWYDRVRAEKRPLKIQRDTVIDGKYMRFNLLLLPFSADGRAVTEIMSCLAYGPDLLAPA